MKVRGWVRAGYGLGLLVAAVAGGLVAHAVQGGPGPSLMYFTGSLANATGPLTGSHRVQFTFRKGATTCVAPETLVAVAADGAFTAPVATGGCAQFFDGSDVNYDVAVDGTVVATNQPLGSVPYARYADVAVSAAGSPLSNIARRTTGAGTLYVRTDGSDTLCDGSADAAASAAPACAYLTLQRAADAVPELGAHAWVINVGDGFHYVSGAGMDLLAYDKQPPLTVRGSGPTFTVLSGASAGNTTVQLGRNGVRVGGHGKVRLEGVRLEWWATGAEAFSGGTLTLVTTTLADNGTGLRCVDAACAMEGAVDVPRYRTEGVRVEGGSLVGGAGSVLTVSAGTGTGLHVTSGARFSSAGTMEFSLINGTGFACQGGSHCTLGALNINGLAGWGVIGAYSAAVFLTGGITFSGPYGILSTSHAYTALTVNGANTSLALSPGGVALQAIAGAALDVNPAGTTPVTVTVTGTGTSVSVNVGARFAAGANVALSAGAPAVSVANASQYYKGGFPAAVLGTTCILSSYCP